MGTEWISGALLAQYGIRPDLVADPKGRVSHSLVLGLLERGEAFRPRPALGVEAALQLDPSELDPIEQASRYSATLGDAVDVLVRNFALLSEAAELSVRTVGGFARLEYVAAEDYAEPQVVVDFALTALLGWARRVSGSEISGACLQLRRRGSEVERERFEGLVGAPVTFGASADALLLPETFRLAQLPLAEHRLARAFGARAELLLSELRARAGLTNRVRAVIGEHLDSGCVTMAWVAKRLGRSVPTLRRHLEDEGATFSGVLDAVRWRRAERLLRDTSMPIWEVAAATGFSNGATFHRAFRRATGTSPAAYRQGTREPPRAPTQTPVSSYPVAWCQARVA